MFSSNFALRGMVVVCLTGVMVLAAAYGQSPTPTPAPSPTPSPVPTPTPSPTPSSAPTLIYRVEFKREGRAYNDPRPRFGYLFVDSGSGAVSSIVVLIDALSRRMYYTTGLLGGRYYEISAIDGDREADVLSASSGSPDGDFAALLLSAKERKNFNFSGGVVVGAAPNLSGWLLLSGGNIGLQGNGTQTGSSAGVSASSTPSPSPSPTPFSVELGYATSAKAEARLQRTASRSFFRRGVSSSEITQFYVEALKAMGIEAASKPNPGPSQSGASQN